MTSVHEMSLMMGVLDTVKTAAEQSGATAVTKVSLSVGEMTEAIAEALEFAFEALTEDTIMEGAELEITYVTPRSLCHACGTEFEHDRFHLGCTNCGSIDTELIAGKELYIDSIEVDMPDDEDDAGEDTAHPPAEEASDTSDTSGNGSATR